MNLTDEEAGCLATFLLARHAAVGGWLQWEDVPNLGEYAFERLAEAAETLAEVLFERSKLLDLRMDIDARLLFERAVDDSAPNGEQMLRRDRG